MTTWADGYGRWHASVPLTYSPKDDARKARRLILAELRERSAAVDPRAVRVEVERVTGHGTIIYREVTDLDN